MNCHNPRKQAGGTWIYSIASTLVLLAGCQLSRTVKVIESPPAQHFVYVEGAVENPGAQKIGNVATLSQVLNLAGGLQTQSARFPAPTVDTDLDIPDGSPHSGNRPRPRPGGVIHGISPTPESTSGPPSPTPTAPEPESDDSETDSQNASSESTGTLTEENTEPGNGGSEPAAVASTEVMTAPHTDPLVVGIQRHRQFDVYYFSAAAVMASRDLIGAIHVFPGDTVSVRRASETGLSSEVLAIAGVPSMTNLAVSEQYFYFVNGEQKQPKSEQAFRSESKDHADATVLWLVRHPPGRAVREHFVHMLHSNDGLAAWLDGNETIVANDQLNYTALEAVPVIASHLIATPAARDFQLDPQRITATTTVTSHDVFVDWDKLHRLKPRWLRHEQLTSRVETSQIEVEPESLEIDSQLRRLPELQGDSQICIPGVLPQPYQRQ